VKNISGPVNPRIPTKDGKILYHISVKHTHTHTHTRARARARASNAFLLQVMQFYYLKYTRCN